MTVSGKFGGQLRASQKTFQHGVIKLNARAIDLDYYRIRTITKYGTFGLRFWVQFRDLRSVRTKKAAADPTSYITPKFRATKKKKG
jgi:ribosomal protein S3